MPRTGKEVYLTALEVQIMCAFVNHLYMTDKEMANELRNLAKKLDQSDEICNHENPSWCDESCSPNYRRKL